jgi:hypothetical protein
MKTIFYCVILTFICFNSYGQTKIYTKYEDFLNGIYEKMDEEYLSWHEGSLGNNLKFKNSYGDIVKYKVKEFWGFTYKEHFFRSVSGEIAMLIDTGKVFYWLNGFAGLDLISRPNNKHGYFSEGESQCYLSSGDINAKIYRMPVNPFVMRDWKSFKKDFSDYDDLLDCISFKNPNWQNNYSMIQDCVKDFNQIIAKRKKDK